MILLVILICMYFKSFNFQTCTICFYLYKICDILSNLSCLLLYLYSFVFLFVGKIALMANVCMFILNADVK